jgi:hypothetical protein
MSRAGLACLLLVVTSTAHADDTDTTPVDTPETTNNSWKVAALTGGIVTAGMAGGFLYSIGKLRETGPSYLTDNNGMLLLDHGHPIESGKFLSYGGYCQQDGHGNYVDMVVDAHGVTHAVPKDACRHGSLYSTMNATTGIGMIVGAGFTMFAVYKGYVSKDARDGHRSSPKTLVVTPVISPDGAGATLRLDW